MSIYDQFKAGLYDLGSGALYAAEDISRGLGSEKYSKAFGSKGEELERAAQASGDPEGFWQTVAREGPEMALMGVATAAGMVAGAPVAIPAIAAGALAGTEYGNTIDEQRDSGEGINRGKAVLGAAGDAAINMIPGGIAKGAKQFKKIKKARKVKPKAVEEAVEEVVEEAPVSKVTGALSSEYKDNVRLDTLAGIRDNYRKIGDSKGVSRMEDAMERQLERLRLKGTHLVKDYKDIPRS